MLKVSLKSKKHKHNFHYLFTTLAMFKQTGYDVEELPDEDDTPHIDCNGTLKVTLYQPYIIFCKVTIFALNFNNFLFHCRFGE